jgi:hypothetical protein
VNVVDLSFMDRMDTILERRDQLTDSIRDNLNSNLSRSQDHMERAVEEARKLVIRKADATEELKEMEAFAISLQLQVRLLRHHAEKTE